jgi:hypothetical protein
MTDARVHATLQPEFSSETSRHEYTKQPHGIRSGPGRFGRFYR